MAIIFYFAPLSIPCHSAIIIGLMTFNKPAKTRILFQFAIFYHNMAQNGSWAPVSGKLIEEILAPLKNMEYIGEKVTLKSSMKTGQNEEIDKLADAICASMMP